MYAYLPIYIIRSPEDNRQYLNSSWPLSMTMACSAKSTHSIKLILFPVCCTSIENACVFVPNFWSQMECCPDVGSTLQEGGISESTGERCYRLPSLSHQYHLPNMTVCDISKPLQGKPKCIKARYVVKHGTWSYTKWATQSVKIKS